MKIALAQINPIVGDIEGNNKKIIEQVKKINADLVVFPELSIVGYCPQDYILKKVFVEKNFIALNNIAGSTKGKMAIVGFIDKGEGNLYNSAAFMENGEVKEIYHKQCLPNYSVFDEKRWFRAGNENSTISIDGKKVGLNICEDIWFSDVCKKQNLNNVDCFINISASPYSSIKIDDIEKVLLQRYEENKKPILYVNQVGAQDGLVYYGHSMFVNNGKVIKKAKDFEEDVLIVDL